MVPFTIIKPPFNCSTLKILSGCVVVLLFILGTNHPDGGLKSGASDHMIETQMVLSVAKHIGWNTSIRVKGHISPVAFFSLFVLQKSNGAMWKLQGGAHGDQPGSGGSERTAGLREPPSHFKLNQHRTPSLGPTAVCIFLCRAETFCGHLNHNAIWMDTHHDLTIMDLRCAWCVFVSGCAYF